MRVLVITGSYPPMKCGVGSYTKRLAAALAECDDVKITVLTDKRAGCLSEHDGVKVIPVIKKWQLGEFSRIKELIKDFKPDIVHIQYPTQGYSGRLAVHLPLLLRLHGIPCVQTWHEPILGKAGIQLSIGLNALIMVKEKLMTHVPSLTRMALFNTGLYWIPSASILPTISLQNQEILEIRHRYVANDKLLLVYYGFIAPLKGIEVLFEIVKKTETKLLLVCDFQSDNAYHQILLDRIASLGIESRVIIVGYLPDQQLTALLIASDAVVLPFRDGAQDWNTSVTAAAAQGTFVLTTSLTKHGYNKEKNIFYANPRNLEEMVLAINNHAGYHIPCKPPTSEWQSIANQHIKIYEKLF